MQVTTVFGQPLPERNAETPTRARRFRILVMGDFGSDTTWGQPMSVDRDNLEEVFQRLNVQLQIPGDAETPPLEMTLREMDDFHPDKLFEQLELFASLRTRRRRLQNNTTFADEAQAILAARGQVDEPAAVTEAKPPPPVEPADLLSQALEQTEQAEKSVVQQVVDGTLNIDDYVRRVVEPYIIEKADPRQAEFIQGVDEAIAATMRNLLHHPSFQRLEAAWLAVRMLVRRLETDTSLQISLLHVTKDQLAEDVGAHDDLTQSKLHHLLVDSPTAADADPWTIVLGDYQFEQSLADTDLLGRVAKIHSAAGTVFIAGASPTIVGCPDLVSSPDPEHWTAADEDVAQQWQQLRSLPASAHVALVLPRILARSAYGKASEPIDSFRFEEIPDGNVHRDYLWMNASFAVGTLLGQSFSAAGWSLGAAWSPEFDDLPLHVYADDGESVIKSCGETELSLRAVEVLSQAGVTTVRSVRNQGAVQISNLRSLSHSQESVAGAWQ